MKICARSLVAVFGVAILAMSPTVSSASTASGNLIVSAVVLNSCTVAVTPLVFGNYAVTSTTPTQAQADVDTICTVGDKVTISMNAGANSSNVGARKMAFGGNTLPYQIYTDTGYGNVWGDGTSNSQTVTTTGTGLLTDTPVYGQIAPGVNVPSGVYTDTVVVTISY